MVANSVLLRRLTASLIAVAFSSYCFAALPSYAQKQTAFRDLSNQVGQVSRFPRVVFVEFVRELSRNIERSLPLEGNKDVRQEVDANQAYKDAMELVESLKAVSSDRQLNRSDIEPVTAEMMKMHESGEDTYDRLIEVYRSLNSLRLSPVDKLEMVRLLGQHEYLSLNYKEATDLFSQADSFDFDSLPELERELFLGKIGNVLYLKGLALSKQSENDLVAVDAFARITSDSRIRKHVEPSTLANIYQRVGRIHFAEKKFEVSAEAFKSGLKVLNENASAERAEKQYRISLEVEYVESAALSKDSKAPDRIQILKDLDRLEKKYRGKGHREFDYVLRKRVLVAKEVGNDEYLSSLKRLREYYLKKRKFAGSLDNFEKTYFLDASALLIDFHIKEKDKKKAMEVMTQTNEKASPPKYWFLKFPKKLVDKALGKSVLDKD